MYKVVREVLPKNNTGVFTIIDIVCKDTDKTLIAKQFRLWLPKSAIKAAKLIRERINYNRLEDIEDKDCVKHVTFYIKNTETTLAFDLIVKALKEKGVSVEIKHEHQ